MGVSARPPGSVASEAQAPPVTAPSPAPPHHPAELLKRQSCTCLPAGQQDGGRESHTPPCRDPLQKLCAHTFHVALTGWNPVLLTQGMPGAASLSLSKIRSSRSIHMQLYLGQHVQDRDRELSASTGSFRGPPFEASPRYVPFPQVRAVAVRASHCGCACLGPGPGAQARQLWPAGLAAPWPVGSSRTRGQSRACCAGRWVLFPLSPQGSPQIPPFLPEPTQRVTDACGPSATIAVRPHEGWVPCALRSAPPPAPVPAPAEHRRVFCPHGLAFSTPPSARNRVGSAAGSSGSAAARFTESLEPVRAELASL